ncbi:MAG: FtsH protease activity modulator HflK [Cytophagales bacterium]|nr:FtsH protease activity modulator HflK [Cytophagales bacterium]
MKLTFLPSVLQRMFNQPPDLDEIWRDVNEKITRFFGGRKKKNDVNQHQFGNTPPPNHSNGNGNNGAGLPPMPNAKTAGIGLGVIFSIIVAIWLLTGFYIVQEGQQAVVTHFGKFKGADSGGITGAGVNWRLPYPFEAHEVVQVSQLRSVEVGRNKVVQTAPSGGAGGAIPSLRDSSMLTQDENIVDVRFVVQYRLKSSADYLFNNRDPDDAVIMAAESAVREVVGKATTNTVLNEKREAIAGDIAKSVQAQLDAYKTGVLISSVNIQNVQPPEQVQAAFDDALKAGQDGDRAKNEGQAYANDVIPRAEGAAARLREEAEGYKARVVSQAEGDASRFKAILPEYQRAPQVMRDRLYTDTMQQIYSNVTKVMVDSKQGSQLLYLPLDKLLQATSGNDAGASNAASAAAPSAAGAASSAAPASGPAAIPNARSRDREAR